MQIKKKIDFINKFIDADNAASGSKVDANANVTVKTMATLEAELYKEDTIKINRAIIGNKMKEMYGEELVKSFKKDIATHLIYVHDETSLKPYCASVTLYPFLLQGTEALGGCSKAPKNLDSFCGSFCNLVYQLASDFAGAIATVEFLMYFDYFARKQFGNNYQDTSHIEIEQYFQQVVYTLNQPAAARGNQSVFWNISIFDKNYFMSMFDEFFFPDGTQPNWESVERLQALFMEWFAEERKKALLTFPVVTAAYLVDEKTKKPKDETFKDLLAHNMSKGLSFFHYESTSADSLSSCCRLRNELIDNTFSYTLGAGGVSTGSFQVITINLNRMIQSHVLLKELLGRIHKYLSVYYEVTKGYIDKGLLPSYSAGFIGLDKQYGTIGINGALESWETMSKELKEVYRDYENYLAVTLFTIKSINAAARNTYSFRFNTEFVPAENLGVKNAKWDREDGFNVPRDCYNSYFFPVEDDEMSILDRLALHGAALSQYLDGGAACHLNLEQLPSKEQAMHLIDTACKLGVPYWTTNVLCTICPTCGFIDPETRTKCKECGETSLDYGTRIIGYLKPISSFSKERQEEAKRRIYSRFVKE